MVLSPAGREGYSGARPHGARGQPMSDPLLDDDEFILDFARLSEGVYEESYLRTKYHFVDDKTWELLGQDESLIEKIMLLRASRVRSGATKRELAQKFIVRGPDTLAKIMDDPQANHRHVVDAIKTLDALADPGPTHTPDSSERFTITINLGADEKIRIDKQIGRIEPNAGEIIDARPQRRREDHHDDDDENMPLFAAIAATKRTDDGNGEPL